MARWYIDHTGKRYKSKKEMCAAYNITTNCYDFRRLYLGYSIQEALETPQIKKTVKDHLGNEYSSATKMCNAYGIKPVTFKDRMKRGWTLEDALTLPVGSNTTRRDTDRIECGIVYDHRGIWYNSVEEMCKRYNISVNRYKNRRALGMDVKDALIDKLDSFNITITGEELESTLKQLVANLSGEYVCLIGNKFSSLDDMAIYYGISTATFHNRIKSKIPMSDIFGLSGRNLWSRISKTRVINPNLKLMGMTDSRLLIGIDKSGTKHFLTIYEALAFGHTSVYDAVTSMLNAQGYGIEALKRAKGLI